MRRFLLVTAALGLAASAVEAREIAGRSLELKTGLVDTSTRPNVLSGAAAFSADVCYVIELDGPMTPDRKSALDGAGVELLEYLPRWAYTARLAHADPARLRALSFVTWVGDFDPAWKLDPLLGVREFQTPERIAIIDEGLIRVAISLFPGSAPTEVLNDLDQVSASVVSSDLNGSQWVVDAITTYPHAVSLANLATVQFVEDAPELTPRNDSNRWILQSNLSNQTPVWSHGLHGEGNIAGIIDTPLGESHCMFDDAVPPGPTHRKIVAYNGNVGSSSHGTHVAGTLAGDSSPHGSYNLNDGIAFAAKIAFTNSSSINSGNLYSSFVTLKNSGARVYCNSWGDDGTTAYTSWCRAIDEFTYDFEDNMVAFATTNASTLRTPENSTNVLAVGASNDTPTQDSHCGGGSGPTADGRRKPEVLAPGCLTTSAFAGTSCSVTNQTGTSMACPAVSGAAVLVRQYFTDGFYPSGEANPADSLTPSGALLRAVVMNGSVDMTGVAGYPSNREGWGRVLLDNALYFADDCRSLYLEDVRNFDGLATGEAAVYTFNVSSTQMPLRVTMTFTQPPASVNTSNPAVNNLDLEVVSPGGALYRGNVFSGGESTTGGIADERNNTEMYIAAAPAVGEYTVTIRGAAVNQNRQGYALVVTGSLGTQPRVMGDIDGDCHVDLSDLSMLLSAFGACSGDPAYDEAADLNESGCVDLSDLATLLANYGL